MKILHYSLGFPPYRTGGLTKYAVDLMQAQVEDGHTVIALWPGEIGVVNHETSIKQRKNVAGIKNFELINPLPVPLDEGIIEFNAYMRICNPDIYDTFLKRIKPDAIHIHTLMGLHKEFIEVANRLKIRIVFTTHDYFGICPKVTLYCNGAACEDDQKCKNCIQCNSSALSLRKILILQSPIYRSLKNSPLVKSLRKQHRSDFFDDKKPQQVSITENETVNMAAKYRKLRKYYIYMLEHVDCIHFNSVVTEMVYNKYLTPKHSLVMTITHKNIADNRRINEWCSSDKLRITSLAPAKPFKGFSVLQEALDELWDSGKKDFELKLFSPVSNPRPYMVIKEDGFHQNEIGQIFAETDILVAPSVWYETFGFTVLESISYGVPVIVSDHVGAKDVVGAGGIIVEAGNIQALKAVIEGLDKIQIQKMHNNIMKMKPQRLWKEFVFENYKLYGEEIE